MAMKVVAPAVSSVFRVVPCSFSLNSLLMISPAMLSSMTSVVKFPLNVVHCKRTPLHRVSAFTSIKNTSGILAKNQGDPREIPSINFYANQC